MDSNTPILGGLGDFFSALGTTAQDYNQYSQQGYQNLYSHDSLRGVLIPGSTPPQNPQQYATDVGQGFDALGTQASALPGAVVSSAAQGLGIKGGLVLLFAALIGFEIVKEL